MLDLFQRRKLSAPIVTGFAAHSASSEHAPRPIAACVSSLQTSHTRCHRYTALVRATSSFSANVPSMSLIKITQSLWYLVGNSLFWVASCCSDNARAAPCVPRDASAPTDRLSEFNSFSSSMMFLANRNSLIISTLLSQPSVDFGDWPLPLSLGFANGLLSRTTNCFEAVFLGKSHSFHSLRDAPRYHLFTGTRGNLIYKSEAETEHPFILSSSFSFHLIRIVHFVLSCYRNLTRWLASSLSHSPYCLYLRRNEVSVNITSFTVIL